MDNRSKKLAARAAGVLESATDPTVRAEAAIAMLDEAKRIRREAFAELKNTRSFAEVGKMFGITGSRVDQIIREEPRAATPKRP
jgi:DNA-directed RNA polymerase sigma subunit (sigma70/sigma32)